MYKMFIDDERFPVSDDFVIVRSSEDAINLATDKGIPSFISFDHDLGGDDTSIVFIKWLVDFMIDNDLTLPENFEYYVHSQNPVGKSNIESWMNNIMKHFKF